MKKRLALISVIIVLAMIMVSALTACKVEGSPDLLGIGDMNFGERLFTGLLVFVMGLGMVFIVLILLILIIKAVAYLQHLPAMLAAKKANEIPVVEEVKEIPAPVQAIECSDEEEVVAAITAAIAAYYGAQAVEMSDLPFRVRSIKEIK